MAQAASTSGTTSKKKSAGFLFLWGSVIAGVLLIALLSIWLFGAKSSNTASPSVASRSNPSAIADICNGLPTPYRLLPGESLNLQGCGRNIYNIAGGKLPVGYVGGGFDLLGENETPRGQIAEIRGPQTGAISFVLLACPRPLLANPITKKCDRP